MAIKLSGDVILSLLTAVCLLALAIISKYILNAQLDFVSLYGPAWVFITYIITRDRAKARLCSSPVFWASAIIIVTVAILVVYAI